MKRFLKRFWLISFIFFLLAHCITKYINHTDFPHGLTRILTSLPIDFMEGRDEFKIQICPSSSVEVVKLLKNNPKNRRIIPQDNSQQFHGKGQPPEYVVLRCKKNYYSAWGNIKCYCSGFPFPFVTYINLSSSVEYYSDIIYPYPAPLDDHIENDYTIKTRWKSFWSTG